jgi:hypothetical protein
LENRNYRPKHRFQAEDKHRAEAEIEDFRAEEHLVVERLSPPSDKLYTSSATPPRASFLLKYKQPKTARDNIELIIPRYGVGGYLLSSRQALELISEIRSSRS